MAVESDSAFQIDSSFKPVLISNMQARFFKEDSRGKFYLLRNLENSRYLKVHLSVYQLIQMFDGVNTLADIERKMQNEEISVDLVQLLKVLAEEGFIANLKEHQTRENGDRLSFKIKLLRLSPQRLDKLCNIFRFTKSPYFRIIYFVFFVSSFSLFLYNLPSIFSTTIEIFAPETSIYPMLLSIPMSYLVEIAHELAHAGTYHSFGGQSTNVGIEFHFFVPFFYTDTPDARWMKAKEKIIVFLAGPLTSLFFAQLFTCLYLLEAQWKVLWAAQAFFWHMSTLVTLIPLIRTDGYFIMQELVKFPNLAQHGTSNLVQMVKCVFRRISFKDYTTYLSEYSASERKILVIYTVLLPIWVFTSVYMFVFLAVKFQLTTILLWTPKILTGEVSNVKVYALWILYIGTTLSIFLAGIIGSLSKALRRYA